MFLEINNINKTFGEGENAVYALRDVSLQVKKGDYLAIMGPSGSGKTTLMNILGCLDKADSGTYYLEGEDISNLSEDKLSLLRLSKIGFVFQNFQLLPQESALDNVALPLIYAKVKKEERMRKAFDALKRVGLEDRVKHIPSKLSGGQKQRVAIARALINNPSIIFADEPTGALDQESGKQIMDIFKRLNDDGVTIIMITHDIDVAKNAKKIVNIIDGSIVDEGISYE